MTEIDLDALLLGEQTADPSTSPAEADFGRDDKSVPQQPAGEPRKEPTGRTKMLSFELIRKLDCPVFLLINKIDLIERAKLLPLIQQLSSLHEFAEVIPISARKKDGLERLMDKLVAVLPEGQRYFPKGSIHGSAGAVSGGGN